MSEQNQNQAVAVRELGAALERFGDRLYTDPALCESVLRDRCGECRREIAVLVAASRSGIPKLLAAEASGTPQSALRARLVQNLMDEHALTNESAAWAVASWMDALGMQPGSAPQPQPQPKKQAAQWNGAGALFLILAVAGGVWIWQTARRNSPVDEHVVGNWSVEEKASASGSLMDRMNAMMPSCSMQIKADGVYTLSGYCRSLGSTTGKITIRDGQWEMRSESGVTLRGTYTVVGPFLTMNSSEPAMPQRWQRNFSDYVRQ